MLNCLKVLYWDYFKIRVSTRILNVLGDFGRYTTYIHTDREEEWIVCMGESIKSQWAPSLEWFAILNDSRKKDENWINKLADKTHRV